ncbi:unnamed protein product [Boreogadus saida]
MGLAGGGKGTPGVSSGALPLLWRFWPLLLVSVLEVEAQTAEDTKPIYIWQTVAMGLAGGGKGTPGVSSGALPLLWRFWPLLLVSVLEVEAQTAEDTKPIYIWQTVQCPMHAIPMLEIIT